MLFIMITNWLPAELASKDLPFQSSPGTHSTNSGNPGITPHIFRESGNHTKHFPRIRESHQTFSGNPGIRTTHFRESGNPTPKLSLSFHLSRIQEFSREFPADSREFPGFPDFENYVFFVNLGEFVIPQHYSRHIPTIC